MNTEKWFTAETMHDIAEDYNEHENNNANARALDYIAQYIQPEIFEAASIGMYKLDFIIDTRNLPYIEAIIHCLHVKGFKAWRLDETPSTILISWGH